MTCLAERILGAARWALLSGSSSSAWWRSGATISSAIAVQVVLWRTKKCSRAWLKETIVWKALWRVPLLIWSIISKWPFKCSCHHHIRFHELTVRSGIWFHTLAYAYFSFGLIINGIPQLGVYKLVNRWYCSGIWASLYCILVLPGGQSVGSTACVV